jgi:hypothetical protein
MDHAAAQRHLATAERLITESRKSIMRQQEIIGTFKCAGRGDPETVTIACVFLRRMQRRLKRHVADRDWFREHLRSQ